MEKIPAYILNLIRNQGSSGGGITPTGEIEITENGTYDVSTYASANVQTPVPTGTISITQNGTVDVSSYANANVNVASTVEIHDCDSLFYNDVRKDEISTLIGICKPTRAESMFNTVSGLTEIPSFDTKNCKKFNYFCGQSSSLTTFPVLDMSGIEFGSMNNTLYQMFQNCPNLTNESLNNILASLLTATPRLVGTKKLSNLGLTSTQATTCTTLSNWQSLADAGWTTGY